METPVIIAVSIVSIVIIASVGSLLFICYNRWVKKRQKAAIDGDTASTNIVLAFDDNVEETRSGNLELESVFTCDDGTIRQLIQTEEWANDVHGVIPHCIAILKMCREITEKLVAVTLENNHHNVHPSYISEIVHVAKCVTPRVDDVMNAIAPPINCRELEARCGTLIYSVQHLAVVLRNAWKSRTSLDWIDAAMETLAPHMAILRHANQQKPISESEHFLVEQHSAEEEEDENFPESKNQISQL